MSIYINDSSKNKKNGKSQKLKNINTNIDNSINLYNLSQKYLNNKYGTKSNNLKYKYLGLIMENLIFNKNSHLVTVFKDYMILDYIEELLKRFYSKKESFDRLPKFAVFYKNYLKFFCLPLIKESFSNNLIHNRFEKKAEFFYKENYKNKKSNNNSSEQDIGLCEDSESSTPSENKNNSNNRIDKTIFNKTLRKKIERHSPINTSMTLPENGSKLKKDDSGLLITYSNENSLYNLMKELDINKLLNKNKNNKKNKAQSLEHKKVSKIIKNNKSLLNDINKNNNDNYYGLSKENNDTYVNEEKLSENNKINKSNFENININNIKNNKNLFGRNDSYKIKKFETQTLKILLNNNYNGLFNSKSCKKLVKNGGLWKLLKNKENMNKDIDDNINTINNNRNNNKQNLLNPKNNNKNKNKILSYIDAINKNFIKNKIHHSKNKNNINNENLSNKYASNSKNGSFGKVNNMKKKSSKITLSKNINLNNNNTNNKDKNQLESIINKIQANAFNSIKKMASRNKKILLKKDSKNSINITRNSNTNNNIYMNKNSYFGLTSNFTNSNIKNENGIIPNLKLRSNSHNDKNGYSSSSSIFDLVEKSKSRKEIDKICNINIYNTNLNKKNSNNLYKGIFQIDELKNNNNVHNVNININNQINVGFNNLNDLKAFSGSKKKNKVQRKIIYRNQNRNEFNTINQNIINNNDYKTSYADDKKSKEKPNLLNKNKLTNQKNSFGNNNNLKLINHYLFRSFKTINNNKI